MPPTSQFREIFRAESDEQRVIAHRGDSSLAPENTIQAAMLGKESGAIAWEFDVHLSRDGIPVVIHDECLLRTTNVADRYSADPRASRGYLVADFDLDEIKTLDAGSWFLKPTGGNRSATGFGTTHQIMPSLSYLIQSGGVRIPTLQEALDWTKAEDWLANVELKSFPHLNPRLTEIVLTTIAELHASEYVLVSSFDHREIRRVVEMAPWLATAALCATPVGRSAMYARDVLGVDALHVSAEVVGASSLAYLQAPCSESLAMDEICELRDQGIRLLVYTVNEAELGTHLFQAGVTAIFSDVPKRYFGMKWLKQARASG